MEDVLVVIRDPDYADDFEFYGDGPGPRIVYLDLGSQFNGPKGYRGMDFEEQREWDEDQLCAVADLPEDHPARIRVQSVIDELKQA